MWTVVCVAAAGGCASGCAGRRGGVHRRQRRRQRRKQSAQVATSRLIPSFLTLAITTCRPDLSPFNIAQDMRCSRPPERRRSALIPNIPTVHTDCLCSRQVWRRRQREQRGGARRRRGLRAVDQDGVLGRGRHRPPAAGDGHRHRRRQSVSRLHPGDMFSAGDMFRRTLSTLLALKLQAVAIATRRRQSVNKSPLQSSSTVNSHKADSLATL